MTRANLCPGRKAGIALAVVATCLIFSAPGSREPQALASAEAEFGRNVVHTDGHLRPGHRETIWIRGFPGPGRTEVIFFPTAICGGECGSVSRKGGRTNRRGAAKFEVPIPGTFFNAEGKRTYFRDRERIDLQVLWYGRDDDDFDVGSADPKPVIFRAH